MSDPAPSTEAHERFHDRSCSSFSLCGALTQPLSSMEQKQIACLASGSAQRRTPREMREGAFVWLLINLLTHLSVRPPSLRACSCKRLLQQTPPPQLKLITGSGCCRTLAHRITSSNITHTLSQVHARRKPLHEDDAATLRGVLDQGCMNPSSDVAMGASTRSTLNFPRTVLVRRCSSPPSLPPQSCV